MATTGTAIWHEVSTDQWRLLYLGREWARVSPDLGDWWAWQVVEWHSGSGRRAVGGTAPTWGAAMAAAEWALRL